jgi:hypothetical protein
MPLTTSPNREWRSPTGGDTLLFSDKQYSPSRKENAIRSVGWLSGACLLSLPAPRLVEELRIGVLEGAEEEVFGSVGAVAVMADGATVIADIQVPVLRLFSPEGTYLGDAGREGEGPGEYKSLLGVRPHTHPS